MTLCDSISPESRPRLYAVHYEGDDEVPPAVLAWGLSFPDGTAVTLWASPRIGSGLSVDDSIRDMEEATAEEPGTHLVWLTPSG